MKYVASLPTWEDWSAEQQRNFLRHCAAPFPLTDGDVQSLIAQIEVARLSRLHAGIGDLVTVAELSAGEPT